MEWMNPGHALRFLLLAGLGGCDGGGGGGGAATTVAYAQVDHATIRLETPSGKLPVGPGTVVVAVTDAGGGPSDSPVVERIAFTRPQAAETAPAAAEAPMRRLAPGRYAGDVALPGAGPWQATITFRDVEGSWRVRMDAPGSE